MDRAVEDNAAIDFASGFYRSLGDGMSAQEAFDLGKAQVLMNNRNAQAPQLRVMAGRNANEIYL